MQVTLGGLMHGVTPLAKANRLVHLMDMPTHFLAALWLPFRRKEAELRAALAQSLGRVSAVFGHADVVQPEL